MNNNQTPKPIKSFLNYASSIRGLTKETRDAYRYDLIMFFRFLKLDKGLVKSTEDFNSIDISDIDNNFIKDIDLDDIYSYLSYLEEERENSAVTRSRKIACLKSFFKFLYSKSKILSVNIASELEQPRVREKLPIYMTVEEAKLLLDSITGRNELRDKCILTLFLNTGMRLSELCRIDIDDIRKDSLVVTGKGHKQRTVYLNPACMKILAVYIREYRDIKIAKHQESALFISERRQRINKRTVEHIMKSAVKNADLSSDYTVHKLRHTAATMLYSSGADIRSLQTILGHSNVSTTQVYTHVNEKQIRNVMNLNPLNE